MKREIGYSSMARQSSRERQKNKSYEDKREEEYDCKPSYTKIQPI